MKTKLFITGIIFLVITFFAASKTFALFETNATGNADFAIGKWVIKLNDRDIALDKLITLDDFTFDEKEHTETGYFAPGSTGEFEIDVDVSDSDVSVEYDIEIDGSNLEEYPNIHFQILDLDTNELMTSRATGVIALDDVEKVRKFKIVLEWEDDPEYNESDTSLIGKAIVFNAHVNFKQYLGE